jgi:hypothetical protein
MKLKFEDETQQEMLKKFEEMLVQNQNGDGWFCGNDVGCDITSW